MKSRLFNILLIVILLAAAIFYLNLPNSKNQFADKQTFDKFYPSEWFDYQRIYPQGSINMKYYKKAMKQVTDLQKKSSRDIAWEFAGPTNIGGRITDIEIHPDEQTTLYIGAASGGIFKSTDNGSDWENVFSEIPTISIGDIEIDPNNKDILYAGTGEANASSYSFIGSGIYKSTDAGNTWTYSGLDNSAYIGRIIVDYNNSNRVFAASCGALFSKNADRGIYRSSDAGETWEKILFLTDSTSGIDLVQHPTEPDILYASMWERFRGLDYRRSFGNTSGIWKTTDGGNNWTELTTGLPTGNDVGRIGISISESNPDILYAVYDMSDYNTEVYKTVDGGNNWTQTNDGSLSDMNSTFGWYFGQIRIDPGNENRVFALGQSFYRTENGGSNWSESSDNMHVDHHAMEFTDDRIWEGNDGGLYYSTNSGTSWIKVNNLPLTQFYDIALDSTYVNRLYGGTQDNNSIRTATGNIDDWEALLGGDGMYCLVDYTDPSTFYCEYQWGGMYRFENDGNDWYDINIYDSRSNWSTPYILHPTNPNILYAGTYRIHKSTNKGDSWTPISDDLTKDGSNSFHTITTIDISKINPSILIVGSADGKVHITTNDGSSWNDISSGLPDRWITRVKTDPFDVNTVYATVSGFRWDEQYSHIFKSTDLGQNWTAIDGNLPEIPINSMAFDTDVENRYFIGTDAGVYMTEDGGENWECISVDIPNVPVTAMEFHSSERKLVIGTYGVSAYKAYIPLPTSAVKDISSDAAINIYPNPVKSGGEFNISIPKFNNSKTGVFSIYTISGILIYENNINIREKNNLLRFKTLQLNGSNFTKGNYIITIQTEKEKISKVLTVY
jgi:photosystem II stability/assembly factor-like uncharacterized protein